MQAQNRTVAGELQSALNELYRKKVAFNYAGRTDSGVHAGGQVVNFHTESEIPIDVLPNVLNRLLPSDMGINSAIKVSDNFHARFSASAREYHYLFSNEEIPFYLKDTVVNAPIKTLQPHLEALRGAVMGIHDFQSFVASGGDQKSTRREIIEFDIQEMTQKMLYENSQIRLYRLRIIANSFLYRMVRNLTGAIWEVLNEKQTVDDFANMLENKEKFYYKTAPAHGLCLVNVEYGGTYNE